MASLSSCFCVVLTCVGTGLATGQTLVQGTLPTVEKHGFENPHLHEAANDIPELQIHGKRREE
jgi:hypothetical protein